jgi:diguanylate cyclase (GGDEF)-like protein
MAGAGAAGVTLILYLGTGLEQTLIWAAWIIACEALLGLTMLMRRPTAAWLRLYAPLHWLACFGWGVLPILFFPDLSTAYQSTLVLVLMAAAVVSLPSTSYVLWLYVPGMVLMLAPVMLMLAFQGVRGGDPVQLVLALFMAGGMAILPVRARQSHQLYTERAREALSLEHARTALREQQERLQQERQRADEAGHRDPVTGVSSQLGFQERLQRQPPGAGSMAVCVRVAGFKYVNMAFGHAIGDEVLREIAARLLELTDDPQLVCRTGGSEFLALLEQPPAEPDALMQQLFERPVETSQESVRVDAYIGLSPLGPGDDPRMALHSAIHAAGEAKAEGRLPVRTLAPGEQTSERQRSLIRFALRDAMENDELSLVYQPQHRLGDQALVGFEALLRWNSPILGAVGPDEFIPVAEETGLIPELGAWICHNAIREFRERFGHTDYRLAINVSLYELEKEDFVAMVRHELDARGLAPERLTLEVTESTFMASPAMIRERLNELREMGVRVSLDDFGTGYSSLSYLTQIPLDEVKIDRAFVEEVADSLVARTLVTSLLNICKALRILPVVEGVEYRRQMEVLEDFPDLIIQGFVFSPPVSARGATSYSTGFHASA